MRSTVPQSNRQVGHRTRTYAYVRSPCVFGVEPAAMLKSVGDAHCMLGDKPSKANNVRYSRYCACATGRNVVSVLPDKR
jgi:hypothetical protein